MQKHVQETIAVDHPLVVSVAESEFYQRRSHTLLSIVSLSDDGHGGRDDDRRYVNVFLANIKYSSNFLFADVHVVVPVTG